MKTWPCPPPRPQFLVRKLAFSGPPQRTEKASQRLIPRATEGQAVLDTHRPLCAALDRRLKAAARKTLVVVLS